MCGSKESQCEKDVKSKVHIAAKKGCLYLVDDRSTDCGSTDHII